MNRVSTMRRLIPAAILLGASAIFLPAGAARADTASQAAAITAQQGFGTPDEAVAALLAAVKTDDGKTLRAILGPAGEPLIDSGDRVADLASGARFSDSYAQAHSLTKQADGSVILSVGDNDWPLPIPLVQSGGKWVFDSAAGVQQILDRRIGSNELLTIQTLYACVDAEKDYFARQRASTGTGTYAGRVFSLPGTKDGLYWDAAADAPPSPLAALVADAQSEGYLPADSTVPDTARQSPYHGYLFRILKSQGPDAPSGAENYIRNGKMTGGFAFIAYPANYGVTGIMTFIINQDGTAFQQDLGPDTASLAAEIKAFNPDFSWSEIVPTN